MKAPRDLDAFVVGRSAQRRIDITLVHGSILDVTTRAMVLGSFRNVDPGGAAKAVDARLGGRLRDLIRTRTVSSEVGTMFVLPTMRSGLRTDMLIFAGLGPFDGFVPEMIELVASNLVRTLVGGNIEEFATVLFGAGSGFEARACTEHLLRGVIGGLRDTDPEGRFRGLTICELDEGKFSSIRDEVVRGCLSDAFRDFDLVVRERRLRASAAADGLASAPRSNARTAAAADSEPMYLLVRTGTESGGVTTMNVALLTAGGKAAVLESACDVRDTEINGLLGSIDSPTFGSAALSELGHRLGRLVLPVAVRTELARSRNRHLVVVHDLAAARLPWEALRLGHWIPATTAGMSRRYVAADLAIGRWAEHRGRQQELALLLIVDPTSDLPGAVDEAERIVGLAAAAPRVRVTRIAQTEVTRQAVLDHLRSEQFDVIHFAGHAFFEPGAPGDSGILCADGPLRAQDLMNLRSLPPLLFFNACEAGRLRRGPGRNRTKAPPDVRGALGTAVGFAEAFMRHGVANFVGTYWPVQDASASTFARAFYALLLSGATIGDALLAGRKAVQARGSVDWADYIHYGDARFRVKDRIG